MVLTIRSAGLRNCTPIHTTIHALSTESFNVLSANSFLKMPAKQHSQAEKQIRFKKLHGRPPVAKPLKRSAYR